MSHITVKQKPLIAFAAVALFLLLLSVLRHATSPLVKASNESALHEANTGISIPVKQQFPPEDLLDEDDGPPRGVGSMDGYESELASGDAFSDMPKTPLSKPAEPKSYREQVAQATTRYKHSPTLTFDHIYVVSLPTREDRRQTMSRIASALNLKFTFVDAVLKESPLIQWIAERVAEVREAKRPYLARATELTPEQVGGMGIDSIWLASAGQKGPKGRTLELPTLKQQRYDGLDWVAYLDKIAFGSDHHLLSSDSKLTQGEVPIEDRLKPSDPHFNITAKLWDPIEPMDSRQLNSAVLSTWFSHLRAMKTMLANQDDSALILEDDVDIEWDIETMWNAIYRRMPRDWQVAYLGHCWGREATNPTGLHPHLFYSHSPRCLHGYALSRSGAERIVGLASDPWVAYQAPVDVIVSTFSLAGLLTPYSIDPPLIMQSKDSPSDIQAGIGSPWRGTMADSTLERIWRDEEKHVPDMKWEAVINDPAVARPHVINNWYR